MQKDILVQYGKNITPDAYTGFLFGKKWDPEMFEINYGDVVQELNDSIVKAEFINRKRQNIFRFNGVGGKMTFGYSEFSFLATKRMALNVPFMKDGYEKVASWQSKLRKNISWNSIFEMLKPWNEEKAILNHEIEDFRILMVKLRILF